MDEFEKVTKEYYESERADDKSKLKFLNISSSPFLYFLNSVCLYFYIHSEFQYFYDSLFPCFCLYLNEFEIGEKRIWWRWKRPGAEEKSKVKFQNISTSVYLYLFNFILLYFYNLYFFDSVFLCFYIWLKFLKMDIFPNCCLIFFNFNGCFKQNKLKLVAQCKNCH